MTVEGLELLEALQITKLALRNEKLLAEPDKYFN